MFLEELNLVEPRQSLLCLFLTRSHISDFVVAEEISTAGTGRMNSIQYDLANLSDFFSFPSMPLCPS